MKKRSSYRSSLIIKKMTKLALFLAVGIILNIVEHLIPLPMPVPGVKLGLANTIGLAVLYYFGPIEFILIGLLRVLLVGVTYTGLFSISFLLSLSGWALSTLIVLIIYPTKKFSIYGLSITSAIFHGVGQILMVMIIYSSYNLILYLPILMFSGLISGALTALVTSLVLSKLNKHLKINKENIDEENEINNLYYDEDKAVNILLELSRKDKKN